MNSNTIKSLLDSKGDRPIISIGPDDNVFAAVTRMVENNIGALLVMENESLCGIITERDYLRFVTLQGRTARDTPVHELMTRKVVYVTAGTDLAEVMAIMTKECIRHIPVMDGKAVLGIISIGDIVKQNSQDQTAKIQVLEEYISDAYPGPSLGTATG